jgi:hypothetical protein
MISCADDEVPVPRWQKETALFPAAPQPEIFSSKIKLAKGRLFADFIGRKCLPELILHW